MYKQYNITKSRVWNFSVNLSCLRIQFSNPGKSTIASKQNLKKCPSEKLTIKKSGSKDFKINTVAAPLIAAASNQKMGQKISK